MPTTLTLDDHVTAIRSGVEALLAGHARAGGEAKVPTCPAWTADALLAHVAMVHRWAAANVRGEGGGAPRRQTAILTEEPDLPGYLRDGAAALVDALAAADDALRAMVFLADAPPPRRFWARRQAHETTIHAVDALAAALGRVPTAAEAVVPTALALDGIDELLRGFLTRGTKVSPLYDGEELTIAVRPTDATAAWTVRVTEGPLAVAAGQVATADVTLRGTAAQLYLGLWNRGEEIAEDGPHAVVQRWRKVRIRWS